MKARLIEHPEFTNRLMDRVTTLETELATLRADASQAAEELARVREENHELTGLIASIMSSFPGEFSTNEPLDLEVCNRNVLKIGRLIGGLRDE